MPKGDWLRHPATGVAIFAVAGLTLAGALNRYQCDCAGSDYAAQTDLSGRENVALALKPPKRNPEPERDEWREEKDLEAQRWMAFWAGALFVVTFAGVVYVARTLDATRAAVKAAQDTVDVTRKIGEAQVRAYLSVTHAEVVDPDFSFAAFDIIVTVKNFGQSPAFDFNWSIEPTLQHFGAVNHLAPDENDLEKFEPFGTATVVSAQTKTVFRFFIKESDVADIVQNKVGGDLYLVGSINLFWKDVFGRMHIGRAWLRPFHDDDSLPDYRGKLMVTNHAPEESEQPSQ